MPTYRPFNYKESWAVLLLLCPATFGLGAWVFWKRWQGIAIEVSDKSGVRLMESGEQVKFGLVWIGAALFVFLFVHRSLFSRVVWDPPKVTAYDWRNRIVYEGPISELYGVEWFLNEMNVKAYRVSGPEGSFVFPDRWTDSSELVKRIAEAVESKDGKLRERE